MIKINILSECEFILRAYLKRFERFGGKELAWKIYGRRLVPSICISATGCLINLHTKRLKIRFRGFTKLETHQEEVEVDRMLCHLSLLESFDS